MLDYFAEKNSIFEFWDVFLVKINGFGQTGKAYFAEPGFELENLVVGCDILMNG